VLYQLSYIPTGSAEDYTCGTRDLSKQMRRWMPAVLLGLAAMAFGGGAAPARAGRLGPVIVAESRCNDQTINESSGQIRDYDRHGPGSSLSSLQERYGKIASILSVLNEERGILQAVCSSEAQKAPLFAELAATSAWALALESDIAAKLSAACPAAARALPSMMLADAWLALANVVNEDGGRVPRSIGEVVPKIQSRAAAAGLTLPAWADTSAYWRDQVRAKAKTAIEACPSPSP
jgi:hypothetical protein